MRTGPFRNCSFSLDNGNEALEAHTGIDIFVGKRLQDAAFLAVELGKNQIPNLGKTSAITRRIACLSFAFRIHAVIVKNL